MIYISFSMVSIILLIMVVETLMQKKKFEATGSTIILHFLSCRYYNMHQLVQKHLIKKKKCINTSELKA